MGDHSVITIDMIVSDNLVSKQYAGQDVKLVFSQSNPVSLGFWLSNSYGHERVGLKDLIEYIGGRAYQVNHPDNKDIADLIKAMPIAFYKMDL